MTGRKRDDSADTEPDLQEEEPFLARWSRRKTESLRTDDAAEPTGEPPAADAPADDGPADDGPVEATAPLTDADMPSLNDLDADADYSPFLAAGISPGLRRKALRQLFRSAKFNITDGLDDYCEDLTTFAPLGDIITAEMKARAERLLRDAMAREAPADMEAGAPEGETPPGEPSAAPHRVAAARGDDDDNPDTPPATGTDAIPGGTHDRDDA
jgi:hypothetical protein